MHFEMLHLTDIKRIALHLIQLNIKKLNGSKRTSSHYINVALIFVEMNKYYFRMIYLDFLLSAYKLDLNSGIEIK